jgi:TIR domain
MNFENDLFISYAHIDNQPLTDGDKGWITRFHATLKKLLVMRLGRDTKIWRDDKLQGNDVFSDEIVACFKRSAVLVSIVTPRYLNSEWCTREAREFCQTAQETGGLVIGSKSRVFKVIKSPLATQKSESLPAHMRDLLGYEFFTLKDGMWLEFDPAYGPEFAQLLNVSTARLASEIQQLLETLEAEGNASRSDDQKVPSKPQVPNQPAVYLAECSYDRREDRKALASELHARGYQVLPDRELPRDEVEYRAEAARLIERCMVSIHLVGGMPGSVPDGPSQCSGVAIQNELAAARARGTGLRRVISLPASTRSDDARHQAFIEAIHRDPDVQYAAEVITAGIEAVKTAVQAALAPPAPAPVAEEVGGAASIYVIFDAKDRKDEALLRLRKCLLSRKLAVFKPAFDGTAEEVRTAHEGNLAESDAVLIYYGSGTDAWKQSIDRDVQKARGRSSGRKLRAVFNWIAAPSSDDKEDIIAEDAAANLIDGRGGVSQKMVDERIVKVVFGERP